MSKYEELRHGYLASKRADEDHWEKLRIALRDLRTEFSTYIGVPEGESVTIGEVKVPVVVIGSLENDTFRLTAFKDLKKQDYGYRFALRVAFDESFNEYPLNFAVFNLHIGASEGNIVITKYGNFAPLKFDGPVLTALYDQLFEDLKESY